MFFKNVFQQTNKSLCEEHINKKENINLMFILFKVGHLRSKVIRSKKLTIQRNSLYMKLIVKSFGGKSFIGPIYSIPITTAVSMN